MIKKEKKDNIKFIIAIASIVTCIGVVWVSVYALKPPGKNKMEKYFERDKADIVLVAEYLVNSGYDDISINKLNYKKGFLSPSLKNDVVVTDKEVVNAIDRLYRKRGYKKIARNGNTMLVEKWIFLEACRGIAFSINGEDEPIIEFLTKIEPLSENGWYYFAADYNEWRRR